MEPTTLPIVVESNPLAEYFTPEVVAAIMQLNVDPVRDSRRSSCVQQMYSRACSSCVAVEHRNVSQVQLLAEEQAE
jgi:hypothetical protein